MLTKEGSTFLETEKDIDMDFLLQLQEFSQHLDFSGGT